MDYNIHGFLLTQHPSFDPYCIIGCTIFDFLGGHRLFFHRACEKLEHFQDITASTKMSSDLEFSILPITSLILSPLLFLTSVF